MAAILEKSDTIIIKQQFQSLECVCKIPCFIQPNTYYLYAPSESDLGENEIEQENNLKLVGRWQEFTQFYQRSLFCQNRQFQGKLFIEEQQLSSVFAPLKCHCNCCQPFNDGLCSCFSCPCKHPEMDIDINLPGIASGYCGSLKIPYIYFCIGNDKNIFGNLKMDVYNKYNQKIYVIESSICQKSTLCQPFRCFGCQNIQYNIKDIEDNTVGSIQNQYNGFVQELCTNFDSFKIQFPKDANFEQKTLLLNAVIWIDYIHYGA